MKKAIIFARVSTKRQEKEGLSLTEIQLPRAQKYAKENNIDVVRTFTISETAGDYKARKIFEEMTAYLIDHPDITEIVSFRVDRITRNFRDAVIMDDLRLKHGKFIHCIDDRLVLHRDSSANDLQNWDTKVYLAKQYLNRVKEDGNNTKYNKLERGELPWGAPYGYEHYTISPRSKTVRTVEPRASIVKEIHTRFNSGSFSCKTLAKAINKDYGTKLHKSAIHRILTDKFYIGVMTDKKTNKEYPHFYEQLVDDGVFQDNQDILAGHSNRRRRYAGVPSVYRGLIDCEFCGCSITPESKTKKQKNGNVHEYMYYHCTNGKEMHTGKMKYFSEKELDRQIMSIFDMFKKMPQVEIDKARTLLKESHESKNKFQDGVLRELRKQRDLVQARIRNSYDAYMDKSITPEEYDENKARYDAELSDLKVQINKLDTADKEYYMTASYLLALMEHAGKLFEVADIDEKRQLLGLVLQNLQLSTKGLILQMKEPFATVLSAEKVLYGWG